MALPPNPVKHARGVKLLLKVGDGASPEQFTQFCSINADRGITFTAGTNDVDIPDCSDPDKLAWIAREKTNLAVTINGGGTLDTRDVASFFAWYESPEPKNCILVVDVPAAEGGLIWDGAFHLTEFSITGNRGEKMQAAVTLNSDGPVTANPNT